MISINKCRIVSIGIDIGTTTTQIVLSELVVENIAGGFRSPNVQITDKKVIYKSNIYFTPFVNRTLIDANAIKKIVDKELVLSGIDKKNISTGAVIITGETSRKENSREVVKALSEYAGDFVVATAGPQLEGILAGYGAGASEQSRILNKKIINFDIGGGTTNAAVFSNGEVIEAYALHIGGRLIQLNEAGEVVYISKEINYLVSDLKIEIGRRIDFDSLKLLTDRFSEILFKLASIKKVEKAQKLLIGMGFVGNQADYIMFSGGVAEFIYSQEQIDKLQGVVRFGDIGPLLGYSIRKRFEEGNNVLTPKEKIRATVIGAGVHSIEISGSTITYEDSILPIKNLPILKVFDDGEEKINEIYARIRQKLSLYEEDGVAIAMKGERCPSYSEIKEIALQIINSLKEKEYPIIVVLENDFGKALGQTLKLYLKNTKEVICIDGIRVKKGDYIDIGKSISGVVPVIVKTLIFN